MEHQNSDTESEGTQPVIGVFASFCDEAFTIGAPPDRIPAPILYCSVVDAATDVPFILLAEALGLIFHSVAVPRPDTWCDTDLSLKVLTFLMEKVLPTTNISGENAEWIWLGPTGQFDRVHPIFGRTRNVEDLLLSPYGNRTLQSLVDFGGNLAKAAWLQLLDGIQTIGKSGVAPKVLR